MSNSNILTNRVAAAIVVPCLLFSATAQAAPQLTEHWEPLSAIGNLNVAATSLPKAITAIEAKTHGKVMNIRFEDDGGGAAIYDAVVVTPHAAWPSL